MTDRLSYLCWWYFTSVSVGVLCERRFILKKLFVWLVVCFMYSYHTLWLVCTSIVNSWHFGKHRANITLKNMELSPLPVKRKKRRTRKCLDELRKRSLHSSLSENSLKQTKSKVNKYTITSKRLTLNPNVFSKSIKSETVTRPVPAKPLSDVQNQICPSVFDISKSRSKTDGIKAETLGSCHLNNDPQLLKQSDQENVKPQHTLFSPVSAPSTSASSHSSRQDSIGYALYTQFLKEVPFHIAQNSPQLISNNVIMKTKMLLQNLYMEGCHRGCQTEHKYLPPDKQCDGSESPESIIENPMDYIKRGVFKGKPIMQQVSLSSSSQSPPAAPLSPQPGSPSPSLIAVVQDTPEYTYYPRKLNQ